MLDDHNQAKLTDFGLSVKITPGQLIKQYCGSPGYMAPEVFIYILIFYFKVFFFFSFFIFIYFIVDISW